MPAVVNTYVVPLMPANATFAASLITPEPIVTVYVNPAALRSLMGFTVATAFEKLTCPVSVTSTFTAHPDEGVSTMLPEPA